MQDIQPSDIHIRYVSSSRVEVDLPDQKSAAILERRPHAWRCQLTDEFYKDSWVVANDIVSNEIELKIQLSGMFQIAGMGQEDIEDSIPLDTM